MSEERPPTRLLVVDDHPLIRDGIEAQLAGRPDMDIAGMASSGEDAIEMTRALAPDIAIMDLGLPGMNGLEVIRILSEVAPETGVIVLTMHDDPEYVLQAAKAGARGYLLKDSDPDELVEAIATVHAGDVYFPKHISDILAHGYVAQVRGETKPTLSSREREVLALIAQGYINKEIAEELALSVRTVETYRERLMRKLDMHSAADLTRYAIAEGIVSVK